MKNQIIYFLLVCVGAAFGLHSYQQHLFVQFGVNKMDMEYFQKQCPEGGGWEVSASSSDARSGTWECMTVKHYTPPEGYGGLIINADNSFSGGRRYDYFTSNAERSFGPYPPQ